jgi:arsenate reductase
MTAHWGIPDPAAVEGAEVERRLAFADALRMLTNRINIFVALPIRSLSDLALQRQLDAIGKLQASKDNPVSAAS